MSTLNRGTLWSPKQLRSRLFPALTIFEPTAHSTYTLAYQRERWQHTIISPTLLKTLSNHHSNRNVEDEDQ